MTSLLSKILEFSERCNFIQLAAVNKSIDHFRYFAAGELLGQNIRNEWIYSNVVNRDENVFPFYAGSSSISRIEDLKEPFSRAREQCEDQLPFSLAETRSENTASHPLLGSSYASENSHFRPKKQTLLRYIAFAVPSAGQQFYYHWQRHRKMWWRKFSANPGRFSLEETKSAETKNVDVACIKAEFPWGFETVETIYNVGTSCLDELSVTNKKHFMAKEGRKLATPHIVESITSLETATLLFLCDAYKEVNEKTKTKELFKLHRKLSPYKFTFAAPPCSARIGDDLHSLSEHIGLNFRKAGLSTLIRPDLSRKSFESNLTRNDELGIPFTIVLRESTLTNGMVGIRSRETTLEEQVHISKLQDYAELLVKNY